MEPLFDSQIAAMWAAGVIDPGPFIDARRLHHECVIVLPPANRVGKPMGSHMSNGSLFRAMGTSLVPNPALCFLKASSPAGVNGKKCFPSDGYSCAPINCTPASHPAAGSQIPDRSWRGAGAAFGSAGIMGESLYHPSRCPSLLRSTGGAPGSGAGNGAPGRVV